QIFDWYPDDFVLKKRPSIDLQSNDLYDLIKDNQRFILKAYLKADEQEEAPRREFQALTLLEATDLAPKPIFFNPQAGPFVIYEFMKGEMWDRKRPSSSQLTELADAWLTINAVQNEQHWLARGSQHPIRYPWVKKMFYEYGAWLETAVYANKATIKRLNQSLQHIKPIFQKIAETTPKRLFSRSDPRFANFIERPNGRLGMIDWEDSGWHDPAYATADLLLHANQEDLLTLDEWQPFLNPYFAERTRTDPQFEQRFVWYMAVLPFFWLGLFLKLSITHHTNGTFDQWQINQLPAAERIANYWRWVEKGSIV
ncbi:MAG: phosphotransferase, partial [Chloroflexota bacterium]